MRKLTDSSGGVMSDVTVTLTAPQVRVLHDALSMIENDPDWVAMLGGRRQMVTLYGAHNRILLARKVGR